MRVANYYVPTESGSSFWNVPDPVLANGSAMIFKVQYQTDYPAVNGIWDIYMYPSPSLSPCISECALLSSGAQTGPNGNSVTCTGVSYVYGHCFLKNGVQGSGQSNNNQSVTSATLQLLA